MNTKLHKQLSELNTSACHNIRFVMEEYNNEVVKIFNDCIPIPEQKFAEDVLEHIEMELNGAIKTLRGIETVINHHRMMHREINKGETHNENDQLQTTE